MQLTQIREFADKVTEQMTFGLANVSEFLSISAQTSVTGNSLLSQDQTSTNTSRNLNRLNKSFEGSGRVLTARTLTKANEIVDYWIATANAHREELAPRVESESTASTQMASVPKKNRSANSSAPKTSYKEDSTSNKSNMTTVVKNPLSERYGDMELIQSQRRTGRQFLEISNVTDENEGNSVWIQGQVAVIRRQRQMVFVNLREGRSTIQALVHQKEASKQMLDYIGAISKESWVEVSGLVKIPMQKDGSRSRIKGATQQVEIHISEMHVMSRAKTTPFEVADAARSTKENEDKGLPAVIQDTRLNNRFIDLRTPANQAIFAVQAGVCQLFRELLMREGFQEIHTPKLIAGSSEGGANVFTLKYFGRDSCLAQSPQLYKQMAIMAGMKRVFEIGPVFRAENSNTHRHLTEFVGLDFEMAIHEHYFELLDVIDELFIHIFEGLNSRFGEMLETIGQQYPFEPLVWKPTRITFAEGIALLRESGVEIGEMEDLSTENEKKLGQLVKTKFATDFFIMYRYPMAIRPFYTMPDPMDKEYSNSYDVFIRGEEIISGAQRIHEPTLLEEAIQGKGISLAQEGIKEYVDSFRYGARPHGGAGIGMERVVMLFLGLDNIRKCSMFPRDPKRLTP